MHPHYSELGHGFLQLTMLCAFETLTSAQLEYKSNHIHAKFLHIYEFVFTAPLLCSVVLTGLA